MPTEPKNSALISSLRGLRDVFDEMMRDLYQRAENLPEEDRLAVACLVVKAIRDHAREGGTYRYLIYNRMGFDAGAYAPLQLAGALEISNEFVLTSQNGSLPEELAELKSLANEAPMEPVPGLTRADGSVIELPGPARRALFDAVFKMEDLLRELVQLREANRRLSQQVEYLEKNKDNETGDSSGQ
jgi:hypothetical protein